MFISVSRLFITPSIPLFLACNKVILFYVNKQKHISAIYFLFTQSGQPIMGLEVFIGIRESVMSLIDHLALAPLVQEYLRAKQHQHQQGVEAWAGAGGAGGTHR